MLRIKSDELERRVDEVLFYKWDPIGVNHFVNARAEYRSYVPVVLASVKSGELSKIIALLKELEIKNMGLSASESSASEVAALLLSHKEAIDSGLA